MRKNATYLCIIGAIVGAACGADGWGWFLFVAVMLLPP
jgi:hypothetical protein